MEDFTESDGQFETGKENWVTIGQTVCLIFMQTNQIFFFNIKVELF